MDGPGLREEDGVVGGQPYPASLEGLKCLMTCPAVPTGHQLGECSVGWPPMSLQASNREHKADHVSPEAHQSAPSTGASSMGTSHTPLSRFVPAPYTPSGNPVSHLSKVLPFPEIQPLPRFPSAGWQRTFQGQSDGLTCSRLQAYIRSLS